MNKDFIWSIRAIGNSEGRFTIGGNEYHSNYRSSIEELITTMPDPLEIVSTKGKLADSEDSFLYCFFTIDPEKENVRISARFEVLETMRIPNQQAGYGILAADTVYSDDEGLGRHRNHLLVGRFRTADGKNHGYGLRIVGRVIRILKPRNTNR